eukprot:3122885-Rhodomonas_salina.3
MLSPTVTPLCKRKCCASLSLLQELERVALRRALAQVTHTVAAAPAPLSRREGPLAEKFPVGGLISPSPNGPPGLFSKTKWVSQNKPPPGPITSIRRHHCHGSLVVLRSTSSSSSTRENAANLKFFNLAAECTTVIDYLKTLWHPGQFLDLFRVIRLLWFMVAGAY